MSKKNGFTLVELMVVIVIIGVLAAVAIPKMMAATAKAKASEGPQILGAIERLEHAANAEYGLFIMIPTNNTAAWQTLGMDGKPFSKYFSFSVDDDDGTKTVNAILNTFDGADRFIAMAEVTSALGAGVSSGTISVNDFGTRGATGTELSALVGSFVQSSSGNRPGGAGGAGGGGTEN